MHSRMILGLVSVLFAGTGCTHIALERRTVKQASTLADVQYQQVLDNLAAFACNPEALPWHVKLKGGLVQVADQGTAEFGAEFGLLDGGNGSKFLPGLSGQRGVVNQWDVDPAVDEDELELLGLAYRKAVNPGDPDLPHNIDKAICRLSVRYDILPEAEALRRIICENGVQEKITGALRAVCKQLEDVKDSNFEDRLNCIKADCGTKADAPTVTAYAKALRKELTHRMLDLLQVQSAVKEMLECPEGVYGSRGLQGTSYAWGGAMTSRESAHRTLSILGIPIQLIAETKPLSAAEQMLFALHLACDPGYIPPAWTHGPNGRNLGLVAQAEFKIQKLQELAKEPKFQQPWLCCGSKKDVPKCACYVGHYCRCGRECYVWVMPDKLEILREFTLAILALAPIEKQDLSTIFPPRGAAFSPTIGR